MTTITTTTTSTTTTLIPFPLNCGKGRDDRLIVANETRFRSVEKQRGEGQLASRQTFRRHTNEACLRRKLYVSLFLFPTLPLLFHRTRLLACPSRTQRRSLSLSRSRSKRHGGKRARRKRDDMPRFGHATPIDTVEPLFLA